MKKEAFDALTPSQQTRLEKLASLPDEAIDTSDIPEVRDWTGAKRGIFYHGALNGEQIAVALDAGIVSWFDSHSTEGENAEQSINRVLSTYIAEETKKAS